MAGKVLIVAMLGLTMSHSIRAQTILPVPGGIIDGKVVVRVYVTLRDDEIPYFPVSGLRIRFLRSASDSVVATTDDAGTITTLLKAGTYRLTSARDVVWKGNRYSWEVPVTVAVGMRPVELHEPTGSPTDAIRVALDDPRGRANRVAVQSAGTVALPPRGVTPLSPKNGGAATLGSLFLVGAGQVYADDVGRGLIMLLVSAAGVATYFDGVGRERDCASSSGCNRNQEKVAGLAVAGLSWFYSVADASPAARRYNERHGIASTRRLVSPLVGVGGRSGIRLGLVLR
jgi:hypothetical protein